MKPAQARDRLFRKGKPFVRPMTDADMGVLWAAYARGGLSHFGEDLDQESFTRVMQAVLSTTSFAWMIEDRNAKFKDGKGPVGMMVGKFDGWALEPHYLPFPWASARNSIRAVTSFLLKARYEKDIGVLNIYTRDKAFFDHLRKRYGVTYYVGKVPRGEYGNDRYVYYGRGGRFFKGIKHELQQSAG